MCDKQILGFIEELFVSSQEVIRAAFNVAGLLVFTAWVCETQLRCFSTKKFRVSNYGSAHK
jgi:hypothetical protein